VYGYEGDAIQNGIQDLDNHVSVRHQQGNTIFEFDGLADNLQKRFVSNTQMKQ
jgi:hypothetical protein